MSISLKAEHSQTITLKARHSVEIALEGQVDVFALAVAYSLDFSKSRNSFYLCLF